MTQERFRFKKPVETPAPEQQTSRVSRQQGERPATATEEIIISGNRVVGKVVQLLREGNALSITVQDSLGNVLFEVPMSVGVIGTVLFPSLTGLVVIGALFANLKIVVERRV